MQLVSFFTIGRETSKVLLVAPAKQRVFYFTNFQNHAFLRRILTLFQPKFQTFFTKNPQTLINID